MLYRSGTTTVLNTGSGETISLTQAGASRIYVDAAGNVGIGTNAPTNKLHLNSGSTAMSLKLDNTLSGNTALGLYNNGTLASWLQGTGSQTNLISEGTRDINLYTNGTVKFNVDGSTGNAGIGTSGDTFRKLYVRGSSSEQYAMTARADYTGSSEMQGINLIVSASGTGTKYGLNSGVYGTSGSSQSMYGIYSLMSKGSATGTAYGIYSTGEDRNYFSNNVSIGTTSASYKLRVYDNNDTNRGVYAEATGNNTITKYGVTGRASGTGGGTNYGIYGEAVSGSGELNGVYSYVYSPSSTAQYGVRSRVWASPGSGSKYGGYFETTGTASTNYGTYLISTGATTNYGIYSDVDGTGTVRGGYFTTVSTSSSSSSAYGVWAATTNNNGTGITRGIYGSAGGTSTGTKYGVYGSTSGSGTRYGVYCSGNGAYTGTWTDVSDKKFKTNIVQLPSVLDKVMLLKPSSYEYKTKEYDFMQFNEGIDYGFIAQDVEKVFPTLVTDNFHPGPTDEDGEYTTEGIDYKGIDYNLFAPIAIKAIQEQQEIIESQGEEIAELKKEIALMKQAKATSQNEGSSASELELLKAEMAEIKAMLGLEAKSTNE